MTDDDGHAIAVNDAWNAVVRGDEPANRSAVPVEDWALVLSLHQAVTLHYRVPEAGAAWQRVLERHDDLNLSAIAPVNQLQGERPTTLAAADAEENPASHISHVTGLPHWRSRWSTITSVIALAAVVVLGLIGSNRGIIAWPPLQPQPGDMLTAFQAVSSDSDPEILALDPEILTARLGSDWYLRSTWAGVADVGAPAFTGFLGSTRLVLEGPDGALFTVEVLPIAGDPSSPARAWAWTSSDIGSTKQSRLIASGSREPAVVSGCHQAIHIEGNRKADQTEVGGITLCAVGSSEIVLIVTSGEILGNEGWTASDRVATLVARELANAPIVPTHRFEGRGETDSGLYQDALIAAPIVRPLTPGTLLRWTGDVAPSPDANREMPWLKMHTADGAEGWVPGDFLVPAPAGEILGSTPDPQ